MDKKYLIKAVAITLLFTILIIPGIFAVGLLSHEFYHYAKHKIYAQAFCFSVNDDHHAFVLLNDTGLNQKDYYLEEVKANNFAKYVTWTYTIIAILSLLWLILILKNKK
ncbi:hypothetical protein D6777_01680 [Candidatus Woesearchaeota archaeon]|nr:MAG: hypothetical protein D6777_01680 [Candidatus Woesearchaeota archaeon]